MGTFNVATGEFTGLTSQQQVTIVLGKPRVIFLPPSATINAVNVQLRFDFVSRGAMPLRVITNDVSTTVPALQNSLSIDLGKARHVSWRIEMPGVVVEDQINIHRPAVIGIGAFTVEVLPISILYEPPQYSGGLSQATMSVTTSVGSSMSLTEEQERSETRSKFVGISGYADKLSKIATLLGNAQLPALKNTVLSYANVLKGFGETTGSNTTGTKVTSEETVDLLTSETIEHQTNAGMGPGVGDRIIYLKDPKLAWVVDQGEVSLTILDTSSGHYAFTVHTLKQELNSILTGTTLVGPISGLSADSLRQLLSLDPLVVTGPQALLSQAALPAGRFVCKGPFGGDGPDSIQATHTMRSTDRTSNASFSSQVTDFKPGWLSVLGIGITQAGSTKMATSHSSTRQVQVGETVTASIKINAAVGEPYHINLYYDIVFGTFVAKKIGNTAVVAFGPGGDACDTQGAPEVFINATDSGTPPAPSGTVVMEWVVNQPVVSMSVVSRPLTQSTFGILGSFKQRR